MKLKTCVICGQPAAGVRCARHALAPRARGNAFQPTRMRVAARDRWTCAVCGERIDPALRRPHPDALHVDHVVRRADGGSDHVDNLRATHARCNLGRPVT